MSKTTTTTAGKASAAAPKAAAKSETKPGATNTPNDDASSAANAGTGAEAVAGAGASEAAVSADGQGDQGTAQTTVGNAAAISGELPGAAHGAAQDDLGTAPDTALAAGSPPSDGIPAWEVLTPFKFKGTVLKPPAWLQMEEEEAKLYQAASVLGTVPAEVPSAE